jgi:hypothetical protein
MIFVRIEVSMTDKEYRLSLARLLPSPASLRFTFGLAMLRWTLRHNINGALEARPGIAVEFNVLG